MQVLRIVTDASNKAAFVDPEGHENQENKSLVAVSVC